MYRCLLKINELKMKSAAFPALGTGAHGYQAKDVAQVLFEAARYFELKTRKQCLKQVDIVIHDKDKKIMKVSEY